MCKSKRGGTKIRRKDLLGLSDKRTARFGLSEDLGPLCDVQVPVSMINSLNIINIIKCLRMIKRKKTYNGKERQHS
jgi:hypothetical protein